MEELSTILATPAINVHALKAEIKTVEVKIRTVKKVLRSPWGDRIPGREQHEHLILRHEVTSLLILRAAVRGRIHTTHRDDATWIRHNVLSLVERFRRPSEIACSTPPRSTWGRRSGLDGGAAWSSRESAVCSTPNSRRSETRAG